MIVGPIGSTMTNDRSFTPALGRADLTGDYDRVIAVMTRERRWRSALLNEIAPAPGEVVVDVGCGTGTFAIMLAKPNLPPA
jgi:ubiquinone/menaquinone biosynthesis C-methylase UbiE